MAKDKYRRIMPEPQQAHEMWSMEICDRLDELITLMKAQNETLVGNRANPVKVELTEPSSEGSKADDKPAPAKTAPAAKPIASSPSSGKAPTARASASTTAKK